MNLINNPILLAVLVAAAVAFALLLLANLSFAGKKQNRLDRVLASYARAMGAGEAAEIATQTPESFRFAALERYQKKVNENLAAAGISLPAQTWIISALAASLLMALLAGLFFGSAMLGLAIGAMTGFYVLSVYPGSRANARAAKFGVELPQALAIIASGLRSGITFQSAFAATANQDKGEVGNQFRRAIAEVQFGSTFEDALRRVSQRMKSDDLAWLVLALEIQREVGGSLSGILDGVSATIKSRAEVKREIRVISSEGRTSGYVLIALPIFSFLALYLVRPEYASYFFTDPTGMVMLGVFVALMVAGWFWMRKAVEVNV
jgi:tight adherence protein B